MEEPEKAKTEEPAKEEAKALGRCRFERHVGTVLNMGRFDFSMAQIKDIQ